MRLFSPWLTLASVLLFITVFTPIRAYSGEWNAEVSFGLDGRYYDYREYVDLPKRSSESGVVAGLVGHYEISNSWLVSTSSLYFSPGLTNYAGTNQAGDLSLNGTTKNIFLFLEEDVGIKLPLGFKIYSGLAYNLWIRDTDPLGHSAYVGLQEDYTWWYIPLGLSWKQDLGTSLFIGLGAEYNFMTSANINARFSKTFTNAADSSVPLGTTLGGKVYAQLGFRLDQKLSITFSPFIQYSGFVMSSVFQMLDTAGNPVLDSNGKGQFFDEPSSSHRSYGTALTMTAALN